ncbi:MAG: GMC oxidoreductase [Pseudoxanthomonas sp.]
MINDYRNLSTPNEIDVDLCIVGAGAAGLAIARTFIGSDAKVCLIESGGFTGEESSQALYEGTSIGTPEFDPGTSRMRVFGGSCNLWGGGCIPIGKLESREWVPNSSWPISYQDLEPYYRHARDFCRIESHEFGEDSFLTPPGVAPLEFAAENLVNKTFAFSPVMFGEAYREDLEQAPNITILLHANLLELEASTGGSSVRHARIGTLEGRAGVVRARQYVLACGGIENARLLLVSRSATPQGLGNQNDLVGRFFMDHPSGKLGTLYTPQADRIAHPYNRDLHKTPTSVHPEICLSEMAQSAFHTLNCRVRLFAVEGPVPNGIQAMRELKSALRARKRDENAVLAERLSLRKNGEPVNGGRPPPPDQHIALLLLRIALGITDIAVACVRKLGNKPTVAADHIDLIGYFEQAPHPDSRITLGQDTDVLGQRKVCVDWRLQPIDHHTYRTAALLFGSELARVSEGRFDPEPWIANEHSEPLVYGTSHHLGTTRMADDPQQGVVDRQCRVHGVDNLYVAGSSVFPTGGWAFPTFTIVALSLRLAEHLRSRLDVACMVTPFVS